jgi:phosphoglycerol transferase
MLPVKITFKKYCICLLTLPKKILACITVLLPVLGVICVVIIIGLPQYILSSREKPFAFYEENYIFPERAAISFPEKKRNLIVIMVESLETGFLTIEDGGAFTEDLMPEVASLAKNNLTISGTGEIGGPHQLYGTEWTIAGIASYYLGMPLAVNFLNQTGWNNYGTLGGQFLPGAYGIGDILENAGYKNYFILGSDAQFGGRDKFFNTHKNTTIYDYLYFRDNGFIPHDYKVWWGIEDRKLYHLAKSKITEIARQEPFFVTLLTADTHPVDGYLDNQAERLFDTQYKNVIRDMSRQLHDFVNWVSRQPFYENTTLVILGDHLYQDSTFFPEHFKTQKLVSRYEKKYFEKNIKEIYNRYPINIFINSLLPQQNIKNRAFSHFDILPALLESIGSVYDAEGIALGRSMSMPGSLTLLEKYGEPLMNEYLRRKSVLYNALWGSER